MEKALQNVALSVVFAALGFVLLFLGFRIFDWLTPTDLRVDVFEKGNVAAALLAGAFVIALAIIIHAAIS
jgi:putative membrane protein